MPSRTSVDIANETLARLAELPNIVGVKDATGDLARASLQRLTCGADWIMLSGDDPSALGYMAHGGHGCISVTANVAPAQCARFYDACLAGDWRRGAAAAGRLIRLHKALFLDARRRRPSSPWPIWACAREEVRLPLAPCAEAVASRDPGGDGARRRDAHEPAS